MDPTAPAPPEQEQYDPNTKVNNALTTTQPGERTVCEIKRHPIGIIGIYVSVGVLLVTLAILGLLVAPHYIHDASGSGSTASKFGVVAFLLVAVISLVYTLIASKVYWGNSWVVTTDSITQIEQGSLFNRQSSQLSLGNLEDVTAEQKGIFPHMFNYGWLRVETAGERSKFIFRYCPNPNYYAQQVLEARENFEQGRVGADQQRTYQSAELYQQPPQQPVQPLAQPEPPYPTEQPQPPQTSQPSQAGDPGYGAYQPYQPPADDNPPNDTSPIDYPNDSTDQGANVGT